MGGSLMGRRWLVGYTGRWLHRALLIFKPDAFRDVLNLTSVIKLTLSVTLLGCAPSLHRLDIFSIGLLCSQDKCVPMVSLHFLNCGAIKYHLITNDGSNAWSMHSGISRGVIPETDKEFSPLLWWASGKPKGHSVQCTTRSTIITGRPNLINDHPFESNRFKTRIGNSW